jgi:hypothetical protein
MNITIFTQEDGHKFQIIFVDDKNQNYGFGITLNVEDVRNLNEKLTAELNELDSKSNFREEVVWNPRSKRHEKVRK